MKRILFPTDFSEVANNAFIHALEFAKVVQGELIVLHTFELPIVDNQFFPENYMVIYESVELAQFDMFKDEIPKLRAIADERNLGHVKMTHRLMDGELIYNVKKAIEEDKIDFVVMGTSGVTGWEAFFSNSNSSNVISGINVPMLCVPKEAIYQPIKTIGFTTRFRSKDKEALKNILKIAHKMHAQIHCLYVKTNNSDVSHNLIKEWETEFANDPIVFSVIYSDEVQASILDFILQKNIDVLTMLTYKRSFLESLFHSSFTEKMTNSLNIPILTIPIE